MVLITMMAVAIWWYWYWDDDNHEKDDGDVVDDDRRDMMIDDIDYNDYIAIDIDIDMTRGERPGCSRAGLHWALTSLSLFNRL